MRCRRAVAVACLAVAAAAAVPSVAHARELWVSEDYERTVTLQTALKSTLLFAYAPDDPILFPERETATGLWRLRFTLDADVTDWMHAEAAYELRARVDSATDAAFGAAGILPPTADAPYRIHQLDFAIVDREGLSLRHEVDRANVAFHPDFGEITVGRQAIGYGRGQLFSAVDVFAPFSPLEVDREWRRGVDAIHAEVRFSDHFSTDVAAGFGESVPDESAFIGRVRGFAGDVDGALLFGWRSTDWLFGATSSATLGDAAVYGEAAWYLTDGDGVDGGWVGTDDWVAKYVAGGSYTLDAEQALSLAGEYHYSGFGLRDVEDATVLLLEPEFQERFTRGDSQLLGRHAFALVLSWGPFADLTTTLTGIVSPVDGSGVVSPGAKWMVSDKLTLVATGFVPWGARPRDGMLRSEWGVVPISAFVQMTFYD